MEKEVDCYSNAEKPLSLLHISLAADKIQTMDKRKNTVMGIIAHVDAGKTTLSEAMLFTSGKIKKIGRVDHRDSYLDNFALERERGITIFSKQAVMELPTRTLTLLDTPGHVDFAAETERTLPVLDCAILVISGTDGVQAHTETLWSLLKKYRVPVFIFVTKTDLPGPSREEHLKELRTRLGDGCISFSDAGDDFYEELSMLDEALMEKYLDGGEISDADISRLIAERKLFPCYFGKGIEPVEGIEEFLDGIDRLAPERDYGSDFGAKVYKIARDPQGNRLTYMKITGGELKVRTQLSYKNEKGEILEEKVNQLRLYSGIKFEPVDSAAAGQVCAVLGLTGTYPGQGLGSEKNSDAPVLEPVLAYTVILPKGVDPQVMYRKMRVLSEEDPQLNIVWNERSGIIFVRLMGRVQTEIFRSLVKERFDIDIQLDSGHIMYRETIKNKVEGVGHFEPLRHYAEVHLILEPMPLGSGIVIDTVCPEDELDRNWQRLILTHLCEKQHLGVLTGSPITDIKITLAAGRAHVKHTEGGDFRQATYRAVRQGLMNAESVLLEPYYSYSLTVPAEQIGRAISDIRTMNGTFSDPENHGDTVTITGTAPVSAMNGYMNEVVAYTRGRGRFTCSPDGYRPCKNDKAVIEKIAYEPESDLENTPDSVFCAHGGGFNVKWNAVPDYMHLESVLKPKTEHTAPVSARRNINIDERELEAIMEREFGPIRRPEYKTAFKNEAPKEITLAPAKKEYIIVDGYNVIFAWSELKKLAEDRLDLARSRLMNILSNYGGFTKSEITIVFDAYRTPGNEGSHSDYHNIHVVYTKDGETGDAYIERIANDIGKNYSVRVITSDNLIRLSALRSGVLRTSSKEFEGEVDWVLGQIDAVLNKTNEKAHLTKLKDGKQ